MDGKLHPAVTVTNIRNFISIILEMENGQYSSWAELFKIHCRAFEVLDHIIPPKTPPKTAPDPDLWARIDAIVLQWIYSTISNDLLHTILTPDSTAAKAWNALANIFQDNVSSYCQALKMLADQLSNVGAPVQNQRLVLQLIAGLNEQYDGVSMLLQQTSPLPEFYEARSKLILEGSRKANQAAGSAAAAATALHVSSQNSSADDQKQDNNNSKGGGGRGSRGRGRGKGKSSGRGRGSSSSQGQQLQQQVGANSGQGQQPYARSWGPYPSPMGLAHATVGLPPCPYPTAAQRNTSAGILGPRPQQQAHSVFEVQQSPTDIEQAMYSMSLNPPDQK
ncbi:hypothetical protein CASFOL_037021 [Castilleja foliolosa]|uniref:Gag protein n=1 Tax=Castilleja foliolosa TaxID=1961234 RepID=A0ABD3BR27_9LAMI